MRDLLTNRRFPGRAAGIALAILLPAAPPASAQAPAPVTFFACYVPSIGAMYMIKLDGLPSACLGASHVEITWTDGAGTGAGTITGVTAGDGLTGGGTTGAVSLAVMFGGPGTATSVARSDHAHQRAGTDNTGVGVNALAANTTGASNTAVGAGALSANTTGANNTALGFRALQSHVGADGNTAIGFEALQRTVSGRLNTAVGAGALEANVTGNQNTALGTQALHSSTAGHNNTAVGIGALHFNQANNNTAVGIAALNANTTGSSNVAMGSSALTSNTTGVQNTALGLNAMYFNVGGSRNTAIGNLALDNMTSGDGNVVVGTDAGGLLTIGSRNVYIGHPGVSSESDAIRIGNPAVATSAYIAGAYANPPVTAAIQLMISSDGRLGSSVSSRRFKEDIHPLGESTNRVLQLRPVRFRYIHSAAEGRNPQQYGLIAEEVAQVLPDLVVYDSAGAPLTVQYQFLPILMLGELQRQARELEEMRAALAAQAAALEELRAELRRVPR